MSLGPGSIADRVEAYRGDGNFEYRRLCTMPILTDDARSTSANQGDNFEGADPFGVGGGCRHDIDDGLNRRRTRLPWDRRRFADFASM